MNVLHSFPGNRGSQAPLLMDRQGNLYGSIVQGGQYGYGAVFKLTPSGDSSVSAPSPARFL